MKRLLSFVGVLLAFCFLPVASAPAKSVRIQPRSFNPQLLLFLLLGWFESVTLWIVAVVLSIGGVAFAQSAPPLPAALTPYADGITLAIGLLSALLVHPLTAIAKRLGRTQGPTTVIISGVLSLLISGGFTLWQAAATHTGAALVPALLSALLAFITANGAYLAQVAAATKGASQSLPTVVVTTAAPQRQVPVGTPGSEPLHQLDGTISAVLPLTPGQPTQVKTGLEKL